MTDTPSAPGWYASEDGDGHRWWDGAAWSTDTADAMGALAEHRRPWQTTDEGDGPPAGWYPDPGRRFHRRWWNGRRWTEGVTDEDGRVQEAAIAAEDVAEARARLEDHRPRWSGWTALVAVGAMVLGTIVGGIGFVVGDQVNSVCALLGSAGGLYLTLLATCWLVSRRQGTGRLRDDFGIRFEGPDWYRGLALMGLARFVGILVTIVLLLVSEDLNGTNTAGLDDHKDSLGFVLAAAVLAVVLAPFFEELFFRGLLQRSLETVLPVPVAIGLQGLLFGLAHLGGAEGLGNVGVILGTAAAGVFFGIGARRYHRLGPGMAGHAWFNLLPVIVLVATR